MRNSARLSSLLQFVSAGLLGFSLAAPAAAQSPVLFSPDITAELGTIGPAIVEDDDAATDDAAGSVGTVLAGMLAALPPSAEVSALEISRTPAVGCLLSVDTTVALPGLPPASPAEPHDVVRFDPVTSTFSVAFDGAASSVPAGVRVDALALDAADDLLLSFDTSVLLPGVGPVDDEDLVRFTGGLYTMVFDGSAQGITADLDLDAANLESGSSNLLLSFDTTGSVPGVTFDDEDVVAFDTVALTYAMHLDASLSDPVDWPAVDLVALPEPALAASLVGASSALALLSRRRARLAAGRRRAISEI